MSFPRRRESIYSISTQKNKISNQVGDDKLLIIEQALIILFLISY
jgi:hypothetical protein